MMYAGSVCWLIVSLAWPSINALMSQQLGPERQGELQGGLASVLGLSSIVGPFVLTETLASFSAPDAPVRFPGAAFLLAALLSFVCLCLLLAQRRALQGSSP